MRREDILIPRTYTSIPNAVLANTVLDPADKLIYAALLWHLYENPTCSPGQATLARETGLSERGAGYCVANLIKHGFITVEKHKGRPLVYTLLPLPTTAKSAVPTTEQSAVPTTEQSAVPTTEQSAVVVSVEPPHSVRTNHRTECGSPPHSVPESTALCADERLKTVLTTEDTEGRKPKSKPSARRKKVDLPPVPLTLNTPRFIAAWADYATHRQQIKCPLTPLAAKMQLNQLIPIGPDRAAAAIENSIANGWKKIVEPDSRRRTNSPAPAIDPDNAPDRGPTAAEIAQDTEFSEEDVRRMWAEKGYALK